MATAVSDRQISRQQSKVKTVHRRPSQQEGLIESERLRHFRLEEFQRLVEMGFFNEDERIELLDGLLVEMSPINPRHANSVDRLSTLLNHLLYKKALVRIQSPITLTGRTSQPQPDITIALLPLEKYESAHPGAEDVQLIIEVSDSSLNDDRVDKLELYASSGITEYWICNLVDSQLEVYREPVYSSLGTGSYNVKLTYTRSQSVAPLAFPDCTIDVSEILPKQR